MTEILALSKLCSARPLSIFFISLCFAVLIGKFIEEPTKKLCSRITSPKHVILIFVTLTLIQPVILNLLIGEHTNSFENLEPMHAKTKLNVNQSISDLQQKDAITPTNLCSYINKNCRWTYLLAGADLGFSRELVFQMLQPFFRPTMLISTLSLKHLQGPI